MPLEPVVESLEAVAEEQRSFYKETEGGYILDVAPKDGYALENIENLKLTLGKERARATEFESRIKSFGDLDPNDIHHKLSRLEELEQIDPSKEADKLLETKLKSIQEQLQQKHKSELAKKDEVLGKTNSYLQKLLIDDAAKSAIIEAGGDERTLTFMLPHVIKSLSVQETENGFVTQVRDEFGNPKIGNSGNLSTVKELILEMKEKPIWGSAFLELNNLVVGCHRTLKVGHLRVLRLQTLKA